MCDAFLHDESFSVMPYERIKNYYPVQQSLIAKNIIKDNKDFDCTSVIINNDGTTSCLVNETDHIRLQCFTSGLDTEKLMQRIYKTDEFLQNYLQFAASLKFGYLTSQIKDCGTGMKISIRIFIPAIVFAGKFESIISLVQEKRFCIRPLFQPKDTADFSNCIFDIFAGNASEGTEFDQMVAIQGLCLLILKTERKIRSDFADNNRTIVQNFVNRAYAKVMYSLLTTYQEGVDIICAVKWGLQTKVLTGITEKELNALLYRTKSGLVSFLLGNVKMTFADDIKNSPDLQIQRLRTIILQQALDNVNLL